MIFIIFISF